MDVYLLPAIVGGGVGDVDEVLTAGRYLARAGLPVHLYRRAGRPLPRGVDGPWAWPSCRRVDRLRPRAPRALTVAPAWGITAAPARPGPLGAPGPWAEEAAEIERTYGAARTAHVSLEEFARTLTSREEEVERFREGGVALREIPARLAQWRASGERDRYLASFRRFRAFDRANVLHLFATFRYDGPFAREHPEAVQVGPLWPGRSRGDARPSRRRTTWLWYASPASAETVAPAVLDGLERAVPGCRLVVRTPRTWTVAAARRRIDLRVAPIASALWRREFRGAALRIVTGSRSLLEALELGGPFLYFNGLVGTAPSRRRHRPEKIIELLRLAHAAGWPSDLCRDLDDFSRGHRLASVVERAAGRREGWQRFPRCPSPVGFAPGFDEAGAVLLRFAGELAAGSVTADELVARTRAQARP